MKKEKAPSVSTVIITVNGHKVNATFCQCPVNEKSLQEIRQHVIDVEAGVK